MPLFLPSTPKTNYNNEMKILTYFSKYNGAAVVIGDCYAQSSNLWLAVGDRDFYLATYDGSMCLEVKDRVNSNGVKVQLWECAGTPNANQRWNGFTDTFVWMNNNNDRCLDVTDGNTETGNQVQIWDCIECVEAINVCLITDSRNPGVTEIKARFSFITSLL